MSEWKLALEVPRWTWWCYTRHLGLVVGLSSIASVQRLVTVNWTQDIDPVVATASEVVVLAARIALVVLVWRIAMAGRTFSWSTGREFARRHWRSLVWQAVFLGVAFAVFEVFAEHVVSALLPASARQTYLAVLLFLKNPTIIALTFLWWIGIVRQTFTDALQQPAEREFSS
ncbi:hypothetical protein [Lentzea flaviverrucosa]|uniref:Uncharacterized protein n=1 Tax=Lentzea flaviverrucosa TaxID=200379 RepID=A0A1H9GJ04_9PSEU|nr:hypothetical protein [Lentzea flaviverrucosa]RDI34895.1 hypothetical protein DFR72_101645 [Lentzea flaviverrucosa]SEQ50003.1 hypothetical protein SAMN05216195_102572 [Lentzea flaviverrucosa]